jgi:hypothetical protein
MQIFLDEVFARHPNDRIIMLIDGAGWHCSEVLEAPLNIYLLKLRPYTPEFNPIEHVWDELREKVLLQPGVQKPLCPGRSSGGGTQVSGRGRDNSLLHSLLALDHWLTFNFTYVVEM